MYKKIQQPIVDNPTFFVTKNRQRLKQYGDKVYLNDKDEFELELFNPLTEKIKATISINGITIGSVVIRPGQRAFLERFLEENRKFIFQTYQVENNNPLVDKAIKNNGLVSVKYFRVKTVNFNINDYLTTTTIVTTKPFTLNNVTTSNFSSQENSSNFFTRSSNVLGGPTNQYSKRLIKTDEVKETGTVEKGSTSNQTFTLDNTDFELYSFKEISWYILPQSQKIEHIDEIVSYCGECGAKKKKDNHKFCPHCGAKY